MSTFYMTYSRSRPDTIVPWVEKHDVPLLTNAIQRWSTHTDRFLDMWEYDTKHVIDAGGYNVQAQYADRGGDLSVDKSDVFEELSSEQPFYPFTVDEYHEWLSMHDDEFEWATAMDYACEDRFNELWSVRDRIDSTVENTIAHYELHPDYNVLPVLQGRTVKQYIDCMERYEDAGIPTDYVGVGTICRLSSENAIVDLESRLRERIAASKLHGFGVKVDAYKLGARFETADSHAWVYAPSHGRCHTLVVDDGMLSIQTREMRNDSLTRTVHSFKVYYAYVTSLIDGVSSVDVEQILDKQSELEFTDERPDDSHVKGCGSP